MATKAKGKTKGASKGASQGKTRNPRCKTCGKVIRVPKGWTQGPAVRRHYWREHPEVMKGDRSS